VQNKRALWELHNLAAAYGQRPSAILEIENSWAAYELDLACLTFGRWVENRLAERDRRGRPVHRLEALLADERESGSPDPDRFRNALGLVKRKVRVKADGTW
jgi:hypothetical protein